MDAMINAEFVQTVQRTAVEASGLQIVPAGEYTHFYDRHSHVHTTQRNEPTPRCDVVQRIEDVVSLVNRRLEEPKFKNINVHAEVYVGDAEIVGVFTEPTGHRRDSVKMSLLLNPAFERLLEIAESEEVVWFDHRRFLDLLRIDLNGCVKASDYGVWKNLKFSSSDTGGSSVAKAGRESIDRSIVRGTLTDDGSDLPDEMVLSVPIYDECAIIDGPTGSKTHELMRWDVTCAVAVDTMGRRFAIRPMTDELERGRREAKQWIIDQMGGLSKGTLLTTGTPSPIGLK
jgi:hypothetical protein